jgi:hypothetical protein
MGLVEGRVVDQQLVVEPLHHEPLPALGLRCHGASIAL